MKPPCQVRAVWIGNANEQAQGCSFENPRRAGGSRRAPYFRQRLVERGDGDRPRACRLGRHPLRVVSGDLQHPGAGETASHRLVSTRAVRDHHPGVRVLDAESSASSHEDPRDDGDVSQPARSNDLWQRAQAHRGGGRSVLSRAGLFPAATASNRSGVHPGGEHFLEPEGPGNLPLRMAGGPLLLLHQQHAGAACSRGYRCCRRTRCWRSRNGVPSGRGWRVCHLSCS